MCFRVSCLEGGREGGREGRKKEEEEDVPGFGEGETHVPYPEDIVENLPTDEDEGVLSEEAVEEGGVMRLGGEEVGEIQRDVA